MMPQVLQKVWEMVKGSRQSKKRREFDSILLGRETGKYVKCESLSSTYLYYL